MVKIAERRNLANIASGKAVLQTVALEDFSPGPERFTKIFAINLSLFWMRPAAKEVNLVRGLLAPRGALYFFYEQPGVARVRAIAEKLTAVLCAHGLVTASSITTTRRSAMLSVVARAR